MIRRCVPLPGPDETLAMYDSTGVSYPLADSRGTPMAKSPGKRALANGQVAVQGYGAFGEEGGSNIGRFGFTGQMRLPEIGLDYYKARFYDPAIGRFMTPDPAGMVDGPNLYAYVLNDPINFTDPSGLYLDCNEFGVCVETEDILIVAPSPFTGVVFDHPPSNGNGQLINTGRGPGTPAAPPMMMMEMPKPEYCTSLGYRTGDFLESKLANGIKIAGAGVVLAGGAVGLSTALTGFGVGAGVAIAASGGFIYAAGTAVSTLGNFTKFLSGQGAGPTAAGLLSVPTMALGPVSQIAADQAVSYFANKDSRLAGPCKK